MSLRLGRIFTSSSRHRSCSGPLSHCILVTEFRLPKPGGPAMATAELYDRIQEATKVIENRWAGKPRIGIILGTGLGGLAGEIEVEADFPYKDLPHFPQSTVTSHAGRL